MATKKRPSAKPADAEKKPASKPADAIVRFESAAALDRWLEKNHATSPAVMVQLGKAGHPPKVSYAEALEAALRWGWIDSVKRSHDATSFLQRFGPRASKSPWSKINVAKAEALIAAGRMPAPGLREVERAKADGRWQRAYDSPKNAVPAEDFVAALKREPEAERLFAALDATNRYAFIYRLGSVKKAETRTRKIAELVAMLARGQVPYPDRLPKKPRPARSS